MKRVTFVKGEVTSGTPATGFVACGDGTEYPLLATLDQIAEIFYRVKDAWFTGGEIYAEYNDGGTYNVWTWDEAIAPVEATPTRAFNSWVSPSTRGYTVEDEGLPASVDSYLGTAYDTTDYLSGYAANYYRDIADNERGMWLPPVVLTTPATAPISLKEGIWWNDPDSAIGIATAFHWSQTGDVSAIYPPERKYYFTYQVDSVNTGGSSSVFFNGGVAVVKVNPTDSDVAPTNTYYIGVKFTASTFSTLKSHGTDNDTGYKYTMQLSASNLSCPIYIPLLEGLYSWDLFTGADFVHKAQEWWSYAKAAGPVWNSATGAKL